MFEPVVDTGPRRRGPYCGPTAIAILTGVPLSRIERMIRRKRRGYTDSAGRKIAVRGTHTWEIVKVLKLLGCQVEQLNRKLHGGETLHAVVKDLPQAATFLVEVTGHLMVTEGGMIADTTYQKSIAIDDYHRKTRRVVTVWRVTAPATPRWTAEHDQQLARRKAERKVARNTAKPPVQVARLSDVERRIKVWERKAKLAKTKLKKLYASRRRYQRLGVGVACPAASNELGSGSAILADMP